MMLENLLDGLPPEQVRRLAQTWKVPFRSNEPIHKTIQQLCAAYTDDRVKEQLDGLSEDQARSLRMLAALFSSSPNPMRLQDGSRKVNELLGVTGQGEHMIRTLTDRGFLFIFQDYWHECIVIPDEVWPILHRGLAEESVSRVLSRGKITGTIESTEHCGLAVYHDVITLLAAIGHDRVEVSQKGQIYKRTMNKIMAHFRGVETYFPVPIGGETQPRYVQFLSDFVQQHDLVFFERVALLHPEAIQAFFGVPYAEWSRYFYAAYLQDLYSEAHALPRQILFSIVYRLGSDAWVRCDTLKNELASLMKPWGVQVTDKHLNQLFYHPFTAFGLIRRGKDERGVEVWRWTEWGTEYILRNTLYSSPEDSRIKELQADRFYVQPNLEIIVPDTILPAVRWQVEAIAELVKSDQAIVYHFTRERTLQALEGGWTMEAIEAFLQRHSHTPPAPNIMRTLQDWGSRYGKAVLWDVMVLEVKDEDDARLAAGDKTLAKLFVGTFSPQAFVIRRKDEQQVRKRMSDLGLLIPSRITNLDPRPKRSYSRGDADPAESLQNNLAVFNPALMTDSVNVAEVASRQLLPDHLADNDDYDEEYDDEFDDEFYDEYEDEDDEEDGNLLF